MIFMSDKKYEFEDMIIFIQTMTGWLSTGPVASMATYELFNYAEVWVFFFGWLGPVGLAIASILIRKFINRKALI